MNRFYNENEGREQAICKAPPHPQLRVDLANIVRSINKILIMPNRRASFLAGNGAGRHTPDPALAARAWVLHPPQCGPSRGLRGTAPGPAEPAGSARPANCVLRRPGTAGKVRAAGRAAAGRREGHVPSQCRRTPASRRPPSLHRLLRGLPGTGLGAGRRELLAPNPPPPAPPGPGHEPGGPSGLPSGRPVPPQPGVLHSRRARGGRLRPRALRPRAERRPAS